ncbi:MAG: hypothetical protein AB8G14_14950 [Ilumatobacter sp.]
MGAEFSGLVTEQIIDCFGQTTHELTLDYDGTVTIRFASSGITARVDPTHRAVLTPGAVVPDQIMDLAVGLRVD